MKTLISKPKKHKIHAFAKDALGKLDAVGLAQALQKKEVSALEVAQAAIARARKVADILNAVEIAAYEEAISRAQREEFPRRLFWGVPTFVKDNSDLEGFPTRNGTRSFTPQKAQEHGKYVKQFLAQGFNVLGKSRMPEFGFNASTEFEGEHPTRNPWNIDYSAGGSSGGAAALVAAGVVPIAHANDGGGSIRLPAACCGLVGLKPTRDRHFNSRTAESMPLNIVSEGVLTRTVRDTAMFHYGMEQFFQNKKLKPIGKVEGPSKRKMRIGFVLDSVTGVKTDAETRAVVQAAATVLEKLNHKVEPITLKVDKSFVDDFTLYWSLLAFMMGSLGKWLLGTDFDPKRLDPFTKGLVNYYKKNFLHTPVAMFRLFRAAELYKEALQPYDAVLTPVLAHTVPKLGYLNPEQDFAQIMERLQRYVLFTPLNNAAGSPAISLPLGACKNGLPIGVQLMAAYGDEAVLLDLAYQLEAEVGFRDITKSP